MFSEHGDHDDHGDDEEMTPEELLEMLDSDGDGMLTWDEFTVIMTDDDDHHEACHDANTHETHDEYTNQADCEAAGHIWMEAHEEDGCHDTTTHETHDEYTNQTDCEAAGHMWMEGDDDHDDHSDEEDDHSDEEDDHDDHSDEEIEFDPHSWLSPLAFKAQADLVVEALSQQYPEHKDCLLYTSDAADE